MDRVRTPVLEVAFESAGAADAPPVVLLHGFPYDAHAFDAVTPILAAQGLRVIVPYVRGYGATRFLSSGTMRSGQQAAVGQDLLELLDALAIERALLAGFDWGARAACIVAALHPRRVSGLVSCGGYQIQDIAAGAHPGPPEQEHRYWYQYYFNTERGRTGLAAHRHDLCKLLWEQWSPTWAFDEATYARTAASFDNPDFVDVCVHSYRHRYGYAEGDARYADIEAQLAKAPPIDVPTIALHGADDGVTPPKLNDARADRFTSRYERRLLDGVGHDVPQEAPAEFARAVLDLARAP
jgi:pimeloyl-ACP methyl ester carboxylesterase